MTLIVPGLKARALEWAAMGFAVFPLEPGGKRSLIPNPHPKGGRERAECKGECGLDGHGFHDATTDPARIKKWWDKQPDANIGWAMPVGVIAFDVDDRHGGLRTILDLLGEYGPWPPTRGHVTGGDDGTHTSTHDFFTVTGVDPDRIRGRLGPGVDVKVGGTGYVVLPPSQHESGRRYIDMMLGGMFDEKGNLVEGWAPRVRRIWRRCLTSGTK
jgi:hypothetical protein